MENFEWHRKKALMNQKKHKVSFDEAMTAFDDPLAIIKYDDDHSMSEQRYFILGNSNKNRLLAVSYTERKNKIRIISARLATKKEKKYYEN